MSASWWIDDEDFGLTYNLNPLLWEAGWRWPDNDGLRSSLEVVTTAHFGSGDGAALNASDSVVWPRDFDGMRAGDVGEKVLYVLSNLRSDPEKYRAMNPPNGWGTYDQAVEEFERFLGAIERNPEGRIGASL